jgi:hypothetical protein
LLVTDPRPVPASEAVLDGAVESTFPASDPISVDHAFYAARERERALNGEGATKRKWPSSE